MSSLSFYLGRAVDGGAQLLYDPADLTTHAVMIGMTGSGKTGLMIAILEEAARQGLPAIIIDPKGDLTNLLLHFPELRPADFAPWIDPEQARRTGTTVDALSEAAAERWRKGLDEWGLAPEDLSALAGAVDYTIFTPGSTAGEPVSLLSSFEAPADWETGKEAHRERIASTVTAVLGLVGMNNIDPLRSREHILLSNILEHAWSRGQSLDLHTLIEQVQVPPFERLGAFPLERFFPEKDRFELALLLNNFLAAPSFQAWLEGQPLNAAELLYTPEGRPRFSIFTLAHLGENERMFFVTLLLAAVEGWMRAQRGSSGLRALLAFDEIVGYLPPVQNPPSRAVLLRLLKQARAFGLGLLLATQNPSDLNYKALSNAGTWFIGRLQTEQDKNRLLDGLQSLESGIDRAAFDRLIASLGQRLFLMHNVHNPVPVIFRTRWVMNYLAGPLTRAQLPALKKPKPVAPVSTAAAGANPTAGAPAASAQASSTEIPARSYAAEVPAVPAAARPAPVASTARPQAAANGYSASRPALPAGTAEFILPLALNLNNALAALGPLRGPLEPAGLVYRPALLAQASVRYLSRRYNLDSLRRFAALLPDPNPQPDWDLLSRPPFDPAALHAPLAPNARFAPLPTAWSTAARLTGAQKEFADWVYRTGTIYVLANEALKVYAGPDTPEADFQRELGLVMRQGLQAAQAKIAAGYDTKLDGLRRRIERQQMTIDRRKDEVGSRKAEQSAADLELFTSLFTRRKRSVSRNLSKRRMTQQAQGELDDARRALDALKQELSSLEADYRQALTRLEDEWRERAAQVASVPVTPLKKDIYIDLFGIAWLPYYQVSSPDGIIEAPGY